ncbi:MAG: hypothetical protein FJX65_00400 [Alphaproteobacteria bacterium]|nr:hypothetical protein [Alphaproteobacteria bacterium]
MNPPRHPREEYGRWLFPVSAIVAWAAMLIAGVLPHTPATAAEAAFKPHYVSLRHATVNARSGPGTRYPIAWVYKRSGMPVEALAEFDNWYKVRDVEGDEAWIHRRLLSSDRTGMILGATRALRADPSEQSAPVAYAEAGVVAKILSCRSQWCRLSLQGRRGWVLRDQLWGTYANEEFN